MAIRKTSINQWNQKVELDAGRISLALAPVELSTAALVVRFSSPPSRPNPQLETASVVFRLLPLAVRSVAYHGDGTSKTQGRQPLGTTDLLSG